MLDRRGLRVRVPRAQAVEIAFVRGARGGRASARLLAVTGSPFGELSLQDFFNNTPFRIRHIRRVFNVFIKFAREPAL